MFFKFYQKILSTIMMYKFYENWLTCVLDLFRFLPRKEIQFHFRNGLKFFARARTSDLGILNEVIIGKIYSKSLNNLPKKSIIVDIGAHIGAFSILAAQQKDTKIISYEPFPESFELLKKNIIINSIQNVSSFNQGISSKKGKHTLYILKDDPACNSLFPDRKSIPIEIDCILLDTVLLSVPSCSLLKIDCEGIEYDILASSKQLQKVQRIILEYDKTTDKHGIISVLQKEGFSIQSDINRILYAVRSIK